MHAPAVEACAPGSPLVQWKQHLADERLELKADFLARPVAAADLLRRLRLIVDRHLAEVWKSQGLPADAALLAVGGYGRGELFPHSDVDLLILLPRPANEALQRQLEQLVGTLWDIGLEVGHSVRTIEDCLAMAEQDITVQTTLLEARLVAGDSALFERFVKATSEALDPSTFLQAKQLEQQQRHARSQETNLEPNIKESPGGLRDLHTIVWVARAAGLGKT